MFKYVLLALPMLLATACQGQQSASKKKAASTAAANSASNNSLLWRVQKGGSKPSYLFGTIHLICKDDYFWNDSMKGALKAAEEVCFEMDLDDPALLLEAMTGLMGMGSSGSDNDAPQKSMRELLTPAEYKRYQRFIKDTLGLDGMMLMAAEAGGPTMVQMLAITKTLDCATPESYEQNIMAEAQGQGKEIVGLEKASEQLAVLGGIPADTSAKSIMKMVDSFEVVRRQFRELVRMYRRQELPALATLMQEQGGEEMGDLRPLLDNRNQKWISKMEAMMKEKRMFFAVGAGHLWGTAGLIQLLRKQGFTVTPVRQ